jgi:branched-chain amino acid transport system ATP-binding protein
MGKSNMTTESPLLEVRNISVQYGKISALKGISLQVHAGQIVSLLGANGAGKTTTLNAISGVIPLTDGDILLEGNSVKTLETHLITRKGIVHVPEGRRIFVDLSVEENLRVASYIYQKKRPAEFSEKLDYVFSLFPILNKRKQQVAGTLSGGEQQMLAIGRALITGGKVLLLDEPSMGLAPIIVEEIFSIIQKVAESGQTILLVEQNAMMAMEISHYCYVLETGLVTYEGTPEALRKQNDIARAYLG